MKFTNADCVKRNTDQGNLWECVFWRANEKDHKQVDKQVRDQVGKPLSSIASKIHKEINK